MDRNIAEQLVAAIAKPDAAAGEIGCIADSVGDVEVRKKVKRLVANVVLDTHEQITLEIVRVYPDLHPDRAELQPNDGKSPY